MFLTPFFVGERPTIILFLRCGYELVLLGIRNLSKNLIERRAHQE